MEDDNIFGLSKKEAMDYIVKGVTKYMVILFIILVGFLLLKEEEPHTKIGSHWKNADINKPVSSIKSLNYETGTVTYRDYEGFKGKIVIPDVPKINGISQEELIERMDLDYHDLIDYYGAEGR